MSTNWICLLMVCLSAKVVVCQLYRQPATTDKPPEVVTYQYGYDYGQQYHHEKKDLKGVVTGEYGYQSPDGWFRIYNYTADENGFRVSRKRLRSRGNYTFSFTNQSGNGQGSQFQSPYFPYTPLRPGQREDRQNNAGQSNGGQYGRPVDAQSAGGQYGGSTQTGANPSGQTGTKPSGTFGSTQTRPSGTGGQYGGSTQTGADPSGQTGTKPSGTFGSTQTRPSGTGGQYGGSTQTGADPSGQTGTKPSGTFGSTQTRPSGTGGQYGGSQTTTGQTRYDQNSAAGQEGGTGNGQATNQYQGSSENTGQYGIGGTTGDQYGENGKTVGSVTASTTSQGSSKYDGTGSATGQTAAGQTTGHQVNYGQQSQGSTSYTGTSSGSRPTQAQTAQSGQTDKSKLQYGGNDQTTGTTGYIQPNSGNGQYGQTSDQLEPKRPFPPTKRIPTVTPASIGTRTATTETAGTDIGIPPLGDFGDSTTQNAGLEYDADIGQGIKQPITPAKRPSTTQNPGSEYDEDIGQGINQPAIPAKTPSTGAAGSTHTPRPWIPKPQTGSDQTQTTYTIPQPGSTQTQPSYTRPQQSNSQPQPSYSRPQQGSTQYQPSYPRPQQTSTQYQPPVTKPQPRPSPIRYDFPSGYPPVSSLPYGQKQQQSTPQYCEVPPGIPKGFPDNLQPLTVTPVGDNQRTPEGHLVGHYKITFPLGYIMEISYTAYQDPVLASQYLPPQNKCQ
ncbi:hypothetical protein CHUAL_011692 [Chamberlinius hualienensis]